LGCRHWLQHAVPVGTTTTQIQRAANWAFPQIFLSVSISDAIDSRLSAAGQKD